MNEPKSGYQINVRLSKEEYFSILAQSERMGLRPATYLRELAKENLEIGDISKIYNLTADIMKLQGEMQSDIRSIKTRLGQIGSKK